jgi:uncharacterized protein with HEPN domain
MAKDPKLYVDHILEAIANIEADIAGHDFDSFRSDRRAKQLVERNLEIISEASRRLPEMLKLNEKDIEWKAIAGIGNVLRHDYHDSHPTILWETCTKDLAPLKAAVTRIARELDQQTTQYGALKA